jgi:hypothetical protein
MRAIYTISVVVWKVSKWVWSVIVITVVVGFATLLFTGPSGGFFSSAAAALQWFRTFGTLQDLTLTIIALYILITVTAGLISVLFRTRYETKPIYEPPAEIKAILNNLESDIKARAEKEAAQKNRDAKALIHYLHATIEANKSISSKGFAAQSQTVIFADLPLEATFVPLQTISDRPVFDAPYEQLRQLELVRQSSGLSDELRSSYMQRLRMVWHSHLGSKRNTAPQTVPANDILRFLTPGRSAAVILGSPGSGKSTLLRWIALYMARASLSQNYIFPSGFVLAQVPLLIRLPDYAESLSKDSLSLREFIAAQVSKIDPNASTKLLDELAHGHCLVLFDGLDEISTPYLRRSVTDALCQFIADYSGEEREINRFLITSRVAGYEPRGLAKYAHYTLLDLDKPQIEQFLTNYCTAIERYQIMSERGMQDLSPVEQETASRVGLEQRERLLQALTNNIDLRQFAVNPLMLTMLAILHASGRSFPYQRLELYQMVVYTLLSTWNQESGRAMFPDAQLPLAELLLDTIAYRLHEAPPVLSAHDLDLLTQETMLAYKQQAYEIKDDVISNSLMYRGAFVETLSRSSGLLVEVGEDLFCLARLAFRDYFVAQFLLREPQDELKQFVLDHCYQASWREPLLLVIAHKIMSDTTAGRKEVNELLQAILNTAISDQAIQQANLVFVINCLTNCIPWWVDRNFHQHVANHLFTFCGVALASGRFTQIPQELKASILAWIGSQVQGQDEQGNVLPLLLAWRLALCDDTYPACQEGATGLLSELASDLPPIPSPILDGMTAPLLQLAGASGFTYPAERVVDFPRPKARAASSVVKEYAHTALLNLAKRCLPGQTYVSWLLSKKQQAVSTEQSSITPLLQQSQVVKQA